MSEILIENITHTLLNGDTRNIGIRCTWVGSKFGTALLPERVLLNTMPWPLTIVDVRDFGRLKLVVRKDVLLGLWAKVYKAYYWRKK